MKLKEILEAKLETSFAKPLDPKTSPELERELARMAADLLANLRELSWLRMRFLLRIEQDRILRRLDDALSDLIRLAQKLVDEIIERKRKPYPYSVIPTGKEILYAGGLIGGKRRVLSLISTAKAYTWPSEIANLLAEIEGKVEMVQDFLR